QMVVDVMADDALFTPGGAAGPGLRAVVKVRLMHAIIRELIMRRSEIAAPLAAAQANGGAAGDTPREAFFARFVTPQGFDAQHPEPWNTVRDGVPINQEQLAATLLTFSWVTLKAIRQFGVRIESDEERAFMHRWNVIGHLLGIDDAITTRLDDTAQAHALFEKMMARNRRATVDGPELARALIGYLESNIAQRAPIFSRLGGKRVVRILTRDLAGDDTADILGIRLGTGDRVYGVPVRLALALFGRLKNVRGLQLVSELVFRWLSRRLWDWRGAAPAEDAAAARREMGSGDVVLPAALTALRENVRRQG
ncbi:MAG: oxygenase MpaB family protein, partial [Gammaproteobacteria bacterium]|nr:oxygenase MpaB family protein [Gammaproteobacteria bacterium]